MPIVVVGVALSWSSPLRGGPLSLAGALAYAFDGPLEALRSITGLTAAFLGMVTLWPFLTERAARIAPDRAVDLLGALRTTGISVAVAAVPLGLVAGRGSIGTGYVFLFAGALVVIVLLADRLIEPGMDRSLPAVLAPAAVVVLRQATRTTGDPITQLWLGTLSGGLVVVVSALVLSRRHAWAAVPLLASAAFYLTPMRPI